MKFDLESLPPLTKDSQIDHIRRRPGMYVGDLGEGGVLQLVNSLLVLAIEGMEGECESCLLVMRGPGEFALTIKAYAPLLETWAEADWDHFMLSRIAFLAVRALTLRLKVEYCGRAYDFTPFGEATPWREIPDLGPNQMRLDFVIDPSLLRTQECKPKTFADRMKLLAMLYLDVKFSFQQDMEPPQALRFPLGMRHLLDEMTADSTSEQLYAIRFADTIMEDPYDLALSFGAGAARPRTFVNSIELTEGGSILDGIVKGIRMALRKALKEAGLRVPTLSKQQILRGCTIAAAIKSKSVEFYGPTRTRLHSPADEEVCYRLVSRMLGAAIAAAPEKLPLLLEAMAPQKSS